MKTLTLAAAAVAALSLTAPLTASPSTRPPEALTAKQANTLQKISRDKTVIRRWINHRFVRDLFIRSTVAVPLNAPEFDRCHALGIRAPLGVCRHAVHLRSQLAVLDDIREQIIEATTPPPQPEPEWWLAQAACIRSHEGGWTTNTGNGFYGAYQFTLSTWQSVGGQGYPHEASSDEQTYRAWMNWASNGHRWGGSQWPNSSRLCGLA